MSVLESLIDLGAGALRRNAVNAVQSREQFHALLQRERACVDRNEHEFSVLVFHPESGSATAEDVLLVLKRRVRRMDTIGWLDSGRIGVLLPYTSASGAKTLAEDISRKTAASPPHYAIYTYPFHRLPAEDGRAADATSSSASAEASAAADTGPGETSIQRSQWPEGLVSGRTPFWKRMIDIVGALLGLVCLSPILLLAAILIKTVSPGPVFLKQKRLGLHGKVFTLWKFRTMGADADASVHENHLQNLITADTPMTKLDAGHDPRIFPFGNMIRRCYVDELPQLINVLRGEMSLVGPRPCMPYEARVYKLWQTGRFDAVPGMTGLWQVSGKNKTTFKQMIRLDIAYARRRSLWLDARIMLKTVPTIIEEIRERAARKLNTARVAQNPRASECLAETDPAVRRSLQQTGGQGRCT